jgi:hypothetical protein
MCVSLLELGRHISESLVLRPRFVDVGVQSLWHQSQQSLLRVAGQRLHLSIGHAKRGAHKLLENLRPPYDVLVVRCPFVMTELNRLTNEEAVDIEGVVAVRIAFGLLSVGKGSSRTLPVQVNVVPVVRRSLPHSVVGREIVFVGEELRRLLVQGFVQCLSELSGVDGQPLLHEELSAHLGVLIVQAVRMAQVEQRPLSLDVYLDESAQVVHRVVRAVDVDVDATLLTRLCVHLRQPVTQVLHVIEEQIAARGLRVDLERRWLHTDGAVLYNEVAPLVDGLLQRPALAELLDVVDLRLGSDESRIRKSSKLPAVRDVLLKIALSMWDWQSTVHRPALRCLSEAARLALFAELAIASALRLARRALGAVAMFFATAAASAKPVLTFDRVATHTSVAARAGAAPVALVATLAWPVRPNRARSAGCTLAVRVASTAARAVPVLVTPRVRVVRVRLRDVPRLRVYGVAVIAPATALSLIARRAPGDLSGFGRRIVVFLVFFFLTVAAALFAAFAFFARQFGHVRIAAIAGPAIAAVVAAVAVRAGACALRERMAAAPARPAGAAAIALIAVAALPVGFASSLPVAPLTGEAVALGAAAGEAVCAARTLRFVVGVNALRTRRTFVAVATLRGALTCRAHHRFF